MFCMVDVPLADKAAINNDTPARISGEVMVMAFKVDLKSCPITVARCGSHKIILAPISINLSTKNKRLSNIFWWISTLPLARRSEERRVGKEWRCVWGAEHKNK